MLLQNLFRKQSVFIIFKIPLINLVCPTKRVGAIFSISIRTTTEGPQNKLNKGEFALVAGGGGGVGSKQGVSWAM